MDMIRAYADKVASYLPVRMQQETADELYDSLVEQFEEQRDGGASESAQTAFVQQQPHPIRMATRLGQDERMYLIGPGFYLSFIEAIKIAALVVAVIHVALFALGVWSSDNLIQSFLQSLFGIPGTLMNAVFIIGLIFVILERTGERASWLDSWNAGDLKRETAHPKISKVETLFELNISALILLWITGAIELPSMIRHDGVWLTDLIANIPSALVGLIVLLLVLDILLAVAKLTRGLWLTSLRLCTVALNLIWIGTLAFLLQIDPLVSPAVMPEALQVDEIMVGVNTAIDVGLVIGIIIVGWDTATHLFRLLVRRTSEQ